MANKAGSCCLLLIFFIGHVHGHLGLLRPYPFFPGSGAGAVKAIVGEGDLSSDDSGKFSYSNELVKKETDSVYKQISSGEAEVATDPAEVDATEAPTKTRTRLSNDVETQYKGGWELVKENAGVSAMHLIVLPNNKAVMFDATVLGPSNLSLPLNNCRKMPNNVEDCWAHAGEFDIDTYEVRPLKVETDTWCSSGGLNVQGELVQAGGWTNDGGRAVRTLGLGETCDWKEYINSLSGQRWYSTQQVLPDGSFIIVGGRNMTNYEFVPAFPGPPQQNPINYELPFLKETTDNIPGAENNLYPHVHLSTDGNLFIMANYRAILFDPKQKVVVRQYPNLNGGARNYPGSAGSAVLPIKLGKYQGTQIPVEVAVCGGAPKEAYELAEKKKIMGPALKTCGRIKVTDPNAKWKIETMPAPRVMADMLILPTGDLMMINGAKLGCSGWEFAEDPYFSPVLYRTTKPKDQRFVELEPSKIARMYHSTAAVLPDGKVLVAGSSTHNGYQYTGVKYPTELRVEKFSPPYLDPQLAVYRPTISTNFGNQALKYGQAFEVGFTLGVQPKSGDIKVTIYSPPFTTHAYSMNQRLVVLGKSGITGAAGNYNVQLTAPPNGAVAPPGYWMLFVVHRGVPSKSIWVKFSSN